MKKILILMLIVFALAGVYGAIPQQLGIQGRLTDSSGNALSGAYSMQFKIYNTASGGSALYDSGSLNVNADGNGIYDIILTGVNLPFGEQYFLGITVGSDSEMTPRINLTSSPYTFRTNVSDYLNFSRNYQMGNLSVEKRIIFNAGSEIQQNRTNALRILGNLSVQKNISAGYFFGDGSGLTNIPSYNATYNSWAGNISTNWTTKVFNKYNDAWSSTYNSTYASYNSTYNATYNSWAGNVSTNWTTKVFNKYNSTWDESGLLSANYVPYTGANADVNLGTRNLDASIITGTVFKSDSYIAKTGTDNYLFSWDNGNSEIDVWQNMNLGNKNITTTGRFTGSGAGLTNIASYNATYNSWAGNISTNWTTKIFDKYNSTWDESGLLASNYVPYTGASQGLNMNGKNISGVRNVTFMGGGADIRWDGTKLIIRVT